MQLLSGRSCRGSTVEEDAAGRGHELHADGGPPLLAARDALDARRGAADQRVGAAAEALHALRMLQ